MMLGVLCQKLGESWIFNLPFTTSIVYDTVGNTWENIGSAVISDNAMYSGIAGIVGIRNTSAALMAFGLSDFEIGLTVKLESIPLLGCVLIDSFKSATYGGEGFQIYVYADGRLSFYQKNTPINEIKTSSPVIFIGDYIKIKVQRVSGIIYLYVDELLVISGLMNVFLESEFSAIGHQFIDFGNGNYPSRGYFRNVYGRFI